MTPYAVGIGLSVAVAVFARLVGFDRDRAFYPTVLIVVASYYVLFAVMGGSTRALAAELAVGAVFVAAAVAGFRRSAWITAAALAGHGILDAFHGHLVDNPGVPAYWPPFCLGYDVGAGAWLAWLTARTPGRA